MSSQAGHILVVDDSLSALRLLETVLKEAGHFVRMADSGLLALASVAASHPDIILLDAMMPDLDGFEVCRRLKEDENTRHIPVLFLSAHNTPDERTKGIKVGGLDFINKPFDQEELLARIATHLELYRLKNEAKDHAAHLQNIYESFDSAVFVVNTEYQYTSFNTAHAEVMKKIYAAEIQLGSCIFEYMTPEDSLVAKRNLDRALGGESFVDEAYSGSEQQQILCFEVNHNPLRSGTSVVGVSVIARDVTLRKEAEEELARLQIKLLHNDKMASVGQLAAGVAHEINNPMGFVNSNLATLKKYIDKFVQYTGLLEEQLEQSGTVSQKQALAILRKELRLNYVFKDIGQLLDESAEGLERVMRIVQDLKTFSRNDTAKTVTADIHQCLDSTINIIMNQIKYVAELTREYGELPPVTCNTQQVNQVFLNLLVNATHAIESKGLQENTGLITVRTWSDGLNVFIAISDTGCGMPEDVQRRIFEPFFTTKDVGKGTGLGLSVSYDIIKKHGGEIAVESEVGRGTVFTVRLPQESESSKS